MAGEERMVVPTFGDLLRRHRERRGLTQEQLADRAGGGLSARPVGNLKCARRAAIVHRWGWPMDDWRPASGCYASCGTEGVSAGTAGITGTSRRAS